MTQDSVQTVATLGTTIAGEDLANNVLDTEIPGVYLGINTATTTVVKSGAGKLYSLFIAAGTLGAVTVYDNTAGSGTTIIPTFTPTIAISIPLNVTFNTGLTIVTGSATVISVSYR